MKRKNRKAVIITFIIVSIFLSACGENRESGTKTGQEPEGPKAADLAVVQEDAGQKPEETVPEEPVQESIAEAESEPEAEPDGMEETESEPEEESGAEDDRTYKSFLIQKEEALEKCIDDLQNHYPNGGVTLHIAEEMEDLDTSALAEMIWERDLETEGEVVPESAVLQEGEEDNLVSPEGTEYKACIYFENDYYLEDEENLLLYEPEKSGPVPGCMQPFVSEEVRAAISAADIEEDEYLRLVVKQDVGTLHYVTYGFLGGGNRLAIEACSYVLLWVSGERADGTHVSQVLEVPMDRIGIDRYILNLMEEDLNRDGEEDLLIETGARYAGDRYYGFLWNGKSGKFELFESLPDYITLWMKNGTLYCSGVSGVTAKFCRKYELIDGIYQETQYVECVWIDAFKRDEDQMNIFRINEYRMGKLVFSKETDDWSEKYGLYPEIPWLE